MYKRQLSNVIIGPNQIEGVHCRGACTLNNVWWSAVCEDAFTIKTQDASQTTYINGGGAFGAEDKVIQHNGAGTVSISGFTVDNFGKLYRSCGNCKKMYKRNVILKNISASSGKTLVGMLRYGNTSHRHLLTISQVLILITETPLNSAISLLVASKKSVSNTREPTTTVRSQLRLGLVLMARTAYTLPVTSLLNKLNEVSSGLYAPLISDYVVVSDITDNTMNRSSLDGIF